MFRIGNALVCTFVVRAYESNERDVWCFRSRVIIMDGALSLEQVWIWRATYDHGGWKNLGPELHAGRTFASVVGAYGFELSDDDVKRIGDALCDYADKEQL